MAEQGGYAVAVSFGFAGQRKNIDFSSFNPHINEIYEKIKAKIQSENMQSYNMFRMIYSGQVLKKGQNTTVDFRHNELIVLPISKPNEIINKNTIFSLNDGEMTKTGGAKKSKKSKSKSKTDYASKTVEQLRKLVLAKGKTIRKRDGSGYNTKAQLIAKLRR